MPGEEKRAEFPALNLPAWQEKNPAPGAILSAILRKEEKVK
jgi:hypothetical protein